MEGRRPPIVIGDSGGATNRQYWMNQTVHNELPHSMPASQRENVASDLKIHILDLA